jgi:hypothetical protein
MDQNNMELLEGQFPLGVWTDLRYEQEALVLNRSEELKKNTMGYVFKANGTLIVRDLAGWCGTPPIITDDYSGKWRLQGNILKIERQYWGGSFIQQWEILEAGSQQATIKLLESESRN